MKTLHTTLSLAVALMLTTSMQAQRRDANYSSDRDNNRDNNSRVETSRSNDNRSAQQSNYRTEQRDNDYRGSFDNRRDYRRDNDRVIKVREREIRHYPREKTVIVTNRPDRFEPNVNRDYVVVNHRGSDYRYYNGRYYRPSNGSYVVVAPPRGIRVNVIPRNYLTIMVGRNPFFYYEGVYYRQVPTSNEYEVVDAPMGAIVPELPQDDVRAVVINGKTYFEYDNILYKAVVTQDGVQYKVMGTISDIQ